MCTGRTSYFRSVQRCRVLQISALPCCALLCPAAGDMLPYRISSAKLKAKHSCAICLRAMPPVANHACRFRSVETNTRHAEGGLVKGTDKDVKSK